MRFRDAFVREYFKDCDYLAACVRMGFSVAYASDYAKSMRYDPYVQRKIAESEDDDDYTKDPDAQKRQVFKLLKKEATYGGPGSTQAARVSALGKLADFLGMNAPIKTEQKVEQKVEHSGGVQFYIPHNGRDALPKEKVDESASG